MIRAFPGGAVPSPNASLDLTISDLSITSVDRDTSVDEPTDASSAEGSPAEDAPAGSNGGDIDLALLQQTLEYIRPAIQMDGGDIVLLGAENGVVDLQMVGACGGCPMSMMTLKAGIERILKDRVPGVEEVNAV